MKEHGFDIKRFYIKRLTGTDGSTTTDLIYIGEVTLATLSFIFTHERLRHNEADEFFLYFRTTINMNEAKSPLQQKLVIVTSRQPQNLILSTIHHDKEK